MHICTNMHVHAFKNWHACTNERTHSHMHARMHACMHAHTCMHAHLHTWMHTLYQSAPTHMNMYITTNIRYIYIYITSKGALNNTEKNYFMQHFYCWHTIRKHNITMFIKYTHNLTQTKHIRKEELKVYFKQNLKIHFVISMKVWTVFDQLQVVQPLLTQNGW